MGKRYHGYTLIELLVVLGIMVIAFSYVIVNTIRSDSMALKASQRIISAVAQGAKGQAILKQAPSRLIIYADQGEGSDKSKYLRYFGIVTQDPQNPRKWIAGTDGTYLPKGIYFMPEFSAIVNGGKNRLGKMHLEYPRISPKISDSRYGNEYYYFEFNPNGTTATKSVNSWLIFGAGKYLNDQSRQLDISFDRPSDYAIKSALIFRKLGTTTLVTDYAEINRLIGMDKDR